jgi:hypothetical protein
MNARDFVSAIRTAVCDSAAKGTINLVQDPPGRRPDPQLVALSHWFRGLRPEDRNNVARIAEMTATQATYNFFLALDGLLTLEPVGAKGKLELFYLKGQTRTRLNSENAEQLSFLFKA